MQTSSYGLLNKKNKKTSFNHSDLTSQTDLDRHVAHDRTLVALQGLLSNSSNVVFTLAKKLLAGCLQHLIVLSLNLHLRQHSSSHVSLSV